MISLGLNIAFEPFSVCILKNNTILSQKTCQSNYRFSEELIHYIQDMLAENNLQTNDIDVIGITNGPGNYTSLRLGITTIKTVGFATKIPVFGYSTLYALASQASPSNSIVMPVIPGRKIDINASVFYTKSGTPPIRLSKDMVIKKANMKDLLNKFETPVLVYGAIETCDSHIDVSNASNLIQTKSSGLFGETLAKLAFTDLQKGTTSNLDDLHPTYSHQPFIGPSKSKSEE